MSALILFAICAYLGSLPALAGPCDIYAAGGTPCVAAHSTTRALYSNFNGALYQVTRGSDNATTDVKPLFTGGVANAATQDLFCLGTTCLISAIYDQSGLDNHLTAAPPGGAAQAPGGFDFVAGATGAPVTLNGQKAYGVFTTMATGYRIDKTKGVAQGNDPEGIYAVLDGTHYNGGCCFDYGNAESNNQDTGATHMEALYFGASVGTASGTGNGPWIQADLENGLFAGNQSGSTNPTNPSIDYRFVTGVVKGNSSNLWSIRGGNAQNGALSTFYDGPRPPGYYPMNKEGSIILGIGGDNSDWAQGTFYEGAMTAGYPDDDTENKVQANVVSAGYATTVMNSGLPLVVGSTVSFLSSDQMYIYHNGSDVQLKQASLGSSQEVKQAMSWKVTSGNGLSDCFSFESVDEPGAFLRHSGYELYCETASDANSGTFADDSTFCTEPGLSGLLTTAFRSYSYPTRYWRYVSDGDVYIGTNGGPFGWDSAQDFNSQASWLVSPALAW